MTDDNKMTPKERPPSPLGEGSFKEELLDFEDSRPDYKGGKTHDFPWMNETDAERDERLSQRPKPKR